MCTSCDVFGPRRWSATGVGEPLTQIGGQALGALCFGVVTTIFVGMVATFLTLGDTQQPIKPLLPAIALFILLVPGVALQSVDDSFGTFAGWIAGTAAGAYLGVALGNYAHRALFPHPLTG